jgi:hypothetical protein
MKKYCYSLLIGCFFCIDSFSQEIRIKRQFFVPQPEYYCEDKYIGNSTRELSYFIETHSQDSLIIQQIKSSVRLSEIYPKIYLYSSISTGIGAIGLVYVIVKVTGSIFNPINQDPFLGVVAKTSSGFMILGVTGLTVAGGYFISSQIKLKKAIKGYNNDIQKDKVTFDIHPYYLQDNAGLTVCLKF